jgi:hypothetical protein
MGDWRVADSAFLSVERELGYWSTTRQQDLMPRLQMQGEKAFKLKFSKEFKWQVLKPYELNSHKKALQVLPSA